MCLRSFSPTLPLYHLIQTLEMSDDNQPNNNSRKKSSKNQSNQKFRFNRISIRNLPSRVDNRHLTYKTIATTKKKPSLNMKNTEQPLADTGLGRYLDRIYLSLWPVTIDASIQVCVCVCIGVYSNIQI